MTKTRIIQVLVFGLIFSKLPAQHFICREANLDPKKNGYYFEVVRKCELYLQKKTQVTSLPLSSQCQHTSGSLQTLSDYFIKHLPDLKDPKDYGKALQRSFKDDKEKVIRVTYGTLLADQTSTINYTQLIISFEKASSSPKILDIQIKSQANLGAFNLSPQEIAELRAKPKPVNQPIAKKKK